MCGSASRQLLPPKFSSLLTELNAFLHDDIYDRNLHVAGKSYKLNKYISRIKAKSYHGIKFT
jgi:hypothetical protein